VKKKKKQFFCTWVVLFAGDRPANNVVHGLCYLQVIDLYDPKEQWASYVINAIKAKEFQVKDVNYIVRKGEVITDPPSFLTAGSNPGE